MTNQITNKPIQQCLSTLVFGVISTVILTNPTSGQTSLKIDSILRVIDSGISDQQKVDSYNELANVIHAEDSAKTIFYANQAIELADRIGYKEGKVDGLYMKAALSMTLGNIVLAAKGFQDVVDHARQIGYKKGEAKGLNGLGATRDFQGDYSGALDYLFQALKINEEVGDQVSAASRYNNIGLVYYAQDDYPNAIKYFNRALDVYEELKDLESVALVSGNIGELYMNQGKLNLASEYFDRSLKLNIEIEKPFGIASGYQNLAEVYREQGDIAKSIDYYQKALEINRDIGGQQFEAQALVGMGIAFQKLKQWRKAKIHLEQGLKLGQQLYHILSIRDGWRHLAEVEEELGNFKAALEAQKNYKQTADSILNTSQTKRLTLLAADYKFQKERDSMAFEQQKATLAFEKEIERQQWIRSTAFAIAMLLGIIAFVSYRSYRVKQKKNLELSHMNEIIGLKNDELTSKNSEISQLRETEKKMAEEALEVKDRELTTVTMLAYEKNNILERLEGQLGKLTDKVDKSVLPDLKEIKRTIQANLSDDSWSSFTYHFEQVHPEFFEKLKEEYTILTQNDLKLCAYLKVGLDNKVIARINSVSPDSVKKSINRLKKKIGLDVESSVRDYIRTYS